MRKLAKLATLMTMVVAVAVSASAETIDFKAMAEPGGSHGESAWSTLTINRTGFSVAITGTQSGNSAWAYLDAGAAGLGVCGNLVSGAASNQITNSGANLCNPSSDDNVTTGEMLRFIFDQDVVVQTIWFNNNHDGDHSLLGDRIDIGGSAYTFTNGGAFVDSFTTTSFSVAANAAFDIAFNNEQFYVSKMSVIVSPSVSVPEPTSLFVTGLGLLGLSSLRRRVR